MFCRSWNNGSCAWPYGQCRYRHHCEKCEGEHPSVNCPFWTSTSPAQPSRPSTPPWSKYQQYYDRDAHLSSEQCKLCTVMLFIIFHLHIHVVCFPFLLMLLCLLHKLRQRAAGPKKSPFPVHAWLPLPFSKIWSFLLGLPPLTLV